ncbi:unnamed protein product [Acanthoscelides obtectus]|uniref:Cyclic nucleotide-binding domain-containing protein n=1 Tax=Acanthoscelides obtectus TaxID=200917 RepID=A0A9P0L957_ACAOB|nr:unnamed protein product [Acanthoscelides obtectus]CAK1658953.1 Potassium channel AKT3 [Acanthoscelides obtectus]
MNEEIGASTASSWRECSRVLLNLPNSTAWNIFIVTTSILNYLLVTVALTVLSNSYMDYLPFFVIFDVSYLLHFVLLNTHRSSKNARKNLTEVVDTSMLCLVADSLSLVPFVMVLTPFFNETYTRFTLLFRLLGVLRLRHVVYFRKKQNSVFKNSLGWCIAEAAILMCLLIYQTNLAWFSLDDEDVQNFLHEFQHSKNSEDEHTVEYLGNSHLFLTHMSTLILFNAGLQEQHLSTRSELYYFITITLAGHFFCITLICSIAWFSIYSNYNRVEDCKKIEDLNRFLKHTDKNMRIKIRKYYKSLWQKERGYLEQSLLHMIPESLQMDVFYDLSCGLLNRSLILKDLPTMVQRKLPIKMITLQSGECAYYQYVVKNGMVCIEDGILEILHHEDGESPVMSLASGSILGEIALIFNVPAKATVRALTNTKLLTLEKSDFVSVMLDYPEELHNIQRTLKDRIDNVKMQNEKRMRYNLKRLKIQINGIRIHDFQGHVQGNASIPNVHLSLYKLSKRNLSNTLAWMFHDECIMMEVWRVAHSLLQIILCIIYPYYVTFVKTVPYWLSVFVRISDFFCVTNLIVKCYTMKNIREQTKLRDIVNERMDDWRVNLDVFSTLPIEVWCNFFENIIDRDRYYDVLQLNRLLRLHHLSYIIKHDCSWKAWLIKSVFCITLFIYYYCCILYLYACFYEICYVNSWFLHKLFELSRNGVAQVNHFSLMFYYVTIYFFRTGNCMIFPKTSDVVVLFTLLTICALLVRSYFLAQIVSHVFMAYATDGWRYLDFKLKRLDEIYSITRSSSERVKQYMTSDSYHYTLSSENFMSETCPKHLRLLLHSSRTGDSLSHIALFKAVDLYCLTLMMKSSKIIRIPKSEIVYYYGDVTRQFFVLINGCCEVYNCEDTFEKIVEAVCDFGTLETIFGIPKKQTVIAATDCDLLMIEYSDLYKVLKTFSKEIDAVEYVRDRSDMRLLVENLDKGRHLEGYPYRDYILLEKSVINLSRIATGYWKIYKQNWGSFWFLAWLLLPVSVNPHGLLFKMWCIVRCVSITIVCILQPIALAITTYEEKLHWIIWICQLSLYLDIYINLHVAVYETGYFRSHPAYTARYYLTHSFVLDLVALLPWESIAYATSTRYRKYWRILKLVQVHRVISCVAYFESDRLRPRASLKIIKMLTLILFVVHLLACFVMNTLCSKDITDSSKTGIDDEMNCQLFSNSSHFKKYLISFQIGTHLLSNTGFTDFEAWSTVPMFLTILLGFVIFSIFSAIIAALILENGRNTFKFRSQAEKLMKFLEKRNVRKSFRRRAYEHLNLIWERTKGINEHCLEELSLGPKLTEDIFLNRYQYVFRDACLFSDVPSTTFKIFVREMKIYHFRKGEIIQRVRDVVSDLFFLTSGQIEVKDEYSDYIRTLEAASVFGNLQRGKYAESKVTLTARRNVETCGLPTERFLSLAKMQPSLLLRIGGYFDRKKDYLLPLAGETDLLKGLKKQSSQYYDMESDEEPVSRKKSLPSITNRSALQFMLINRWFKFGLKPDHKIFEMIDIMTVMSTVINLLIIPYVFVTQDSSPYYFVYLSLEPVYYLRLVMKFHKGFISYYGNFIFTNAKIAKKYLNSPREVFWDVVPNLPLELVCFTFHQEDWFFFYTCFRLIHMLRFYYIPNYFNTKEEILTMEKWLPLMKIMVYSILCCHFMACVFLFAACPFGSCLSESWMQSISGTSTEITLQNKMLLTYLYVITLMTTTDIGSIVRKRWFEICFSSMSVLLGKVMVAVWIGEMLRVLLTYGIPFMDYGNKTRLLLEQSKNNGISGNFCMYKRMQIPRCLY